MTEIINAKITNTQLIMGDHGCLTYWIDVEGGGFGVSVGGYCIGHGYLGATKFDGSAKGLEALMRIMNVVGVEKWEDLKGKYCRIVSDGLGSRVNKIGNLIEDKWFDQEKFFAENV